jgi:NhaP-type Na+/H+ or K+/H+ antiporter
MIEILLVIATVKTAAVLREKGRGAAGYVLSFIALWFCGEMIGAVIGGVVHKVAAPMMGLPIRPQTAAMITMYSFAVVGAVIAGAIGFAIAAAFPAIEQPRGHDLRAFEDDDEDEYERKLRQRREADADGKLKEQRPVRRADDGEFEEDRSGH